MTRFYVEVRGTVEAETAEEALRSFQEIVPDYQEAGPLCKGLVENTERFCRHAFLVPREDPNTLVIGAPSSLKLLECADTHRGITITEYGIREFNSIEE